MNPEKKLPLEGVYAYHNKKNNTIRIAGTDEELPGFNITLDKNTITTATLRKRMEKEGVINPTVDTMIAGTSQMGLDNATYHSGLTLIHVRDKDRISRLRIPEQWIPLYAKRVNGGTIRIGINCENIATLGLSGNAGSGKTTFIRQQFEPSETSILDFANIDYGVMSPSQKEQYGNDISREFLRDSFKKFLVLDHYSAHLAKGKSKHHPTLFFETFKQIAEHAKMFRKAGKTLVISDVDDKGSLEHVNTDECIEFFGNNVYMNYGFSFYNTDFPKI